MGFVEGTLWCECFQRLSWQQRRTAAADLARVMAGAYSLSSTYCGSLLADCTLGDDQKAVRYGGDASPAPHFPFPTVRCEGPSGNYVVGPLNDVVFLDPMFPERTKSAAVKKKFQLLHHLERPCDNEGELLDAALAARPRKVVIKRPPKGSWLAGARPSHSVAGKAVRYDVIVSPRDSGGHPA